VSGQLSADSEYGMRTVGASFRHRMPGPERPGSESLTLRSGSAPRRASCHTGLLRGRARRPQQARPSQEQRATTRRKMNRAPRPPTPAGTCDFPDPGIRRVLRQNSGGSGPGSGSWGVPGGSAPTRLGPLGGRWVLLWVLGRVC